VGGLLVILEELSGYPDWISRAHTQRDTKRKNIAATPRTLNTTLPLNDSSSSGTSDEHDRSLTEVRTIRRDSLYREEKE
jgi:hypothetical protein